MKSGYSQSSVTWELSGGAAGTTECIWGRGDARAVGPRRGIDGVERYSIPGFS
ncbi:hypothetical protein SynA15127_00853 [Synechococcus sp. A15-127]|nr:hypothetical protein SynA15127_00853 [Synechococcus sp. A15-127]